MVEFIDASNVDACAWFTIDLRSPQIGLCLVHKKANSPYAHLRGQLTEYQSMDRFDNKPVDHNELYGTCILGFQNQYTGEGFTELVGSGGSVRRVFALCDINTAGSASYPESFYHEGQSVKARWGPVGENKFQVVYGTKNANAKNWTCSRLDITWDGKYFCYYRTVRSIGSFLDVPPPSLKLGFITSTQRSSWWPNRIDPSDANAIGLTLLERAKTAIYHAHPDIRNPDNVFGDLSQLIANDAKYIDTNLWTLLPELSNIKDGLLENVQVWRDIAKQKTLRGVGAQTSSAYLSTLYGPRLTFLDVQEQAKTLASRILRDSKNRWIHAKKQAHATFQGLVTPLIGCDIDVTYALNVWYDRNVSGLVDFLSRLSAFPQLTDAWDMVPYSFVVDWFVGVEDFLDAIDARVNIAVLPVQTTTQSWRARSSFTWGPIPGCLFSGYIEVYHRLVWPYLVYPTPRLTGNSLASFGHVPEATALVVQRLG